MQTTFYVLSGYALITVVLHLCPVVLKLPGTVSSHPGTAL